MGLIINDRRICLSADKAGIIRCTAQNVCFSPTNQLLSFQRFTWLKKKLFFVTNKTETIQRSNKKAKKLLFNILQLSRILSYIEELALQRGDAVVFYIFFPKEFLTCFHSQQKLRRAVKFQIRFLLFREILRKSNIKSNIMKNSFSTK